MTMRTITVPARLHEVAALALMLEMAERGAAHLDAGPYRVLASRLADALSTQPMDEPLDQLLGAFPAAAEVYENLQYAHGGLVRSRLDHAVAAEHGARSLIARLRAVTSDPGPPSDAQPTSG
ncbi:MAG: hypothetical protein MUF03_07535 [Rubrivivax sp.]|jgi:hypothetical protein|nr:hypothetical protein [Rubrivivax sp.]